MTNDKEFDAIFNIPIHIQVELETPDWSYNSRCNNWKNYIDDEIRQLWNQLSFREKFIIAHFAEFQASQEEWD